MTESLSVAVLYQGTCRCWRNLHQKQWGCRTALGMTGGKDKTQWARKTETPSVWYSLDKVLTWSWPGSIMLYTCKLPRLLVRPLLLSVHLQKPSACVLPRSPKNTHTQRFSLSLSLGMAIRRTLCWEFAWIVSPTWSIFRMSMISRCTSSMIIVHWKGLSNK